MQTDAHFSFISIRYYNIITAHRHSLVRSLDQCSSCACFSVFVVAKTDTFMKCWTLYFLLNYNVIVTVWYVSECGHCMWSFPLSSICKQSTETHSLLL